MDFQNFRVTRAQNRNLTVPTWTVELQIVHPSTGQIVRDFTGANALSFPQVLGQLTAAQQDEFVRDAVFSLVRKRAGIE